MRSLIIVLIACIALMNACKKTGIEKRGDSLSIQLHECADNIFSDNQVRLCFDSIISDSRCPSNAVCIWRGTAVCKFSFFKNTQVYPLILSTFPLPGVYDKDTILSGYKIEFINLTPYPSLPPVYDKNNEIKVEVKITKL